MKKRVALLALTAACLSGRIALADIRIDESAVKSLNVTVYNNGLGLVRDSRAVNLPAGVSTLSFRGVSAQIQPETALLDGARTEFQL